MSEEASCAGADPKYFLIFSFEKSLADRKLYSSASGYKRNAAKGENLEAHVDVSPAMESLIRWKKRRC